MKTITIRLSDVEAAMLVEVAKTHRSFRSLQKLFISHIRQEYDRLSADKPRSG